MTAHDWEAILLPELRQALPQYASKRLTLSLARPSFDYTNSRLHFFDLLAEGRPVQELAIKEVREAAQSEVWLEFQGMNRLWAHLAGHPHIRAPRPLFWLARPPALAMEAARGERLHRVLAACRRPQRPARYSQALACVHLAGQALSLLHQIAPAPNATLLPAPAARAEAAFHRLLGVGVPAGQIDDLHRRLEPVLASQPPSGPLVALHGDYTLRNLLCAADGALTILDTSLDTAGPPSHDVGYFLASLAFIDRWQLLAGRLAWPPANIAAMREAFLAGYGDGDGWGRGLTHGPDPDAGLDAGQLQLFTALRLLERWGQYAETWQASRSRVARWVLGARGQRYFAGAVAEAMVERDSNR
ncbi:MAG: phosphotransferase [Caldilineales bacterium]|nr:phosphotransferase [Caldilineales bacterium]